jgi:hypothetical protein
MGIAPETKLIVKHTFLEIVPDGPSSPEKRNRSLTEGAMTCLERTGGEVYNVSSVDAGVQAAVEKQFRAAEQARRTAQGPVQQNADQYRPCPQRSVVASPSVVSQSTPWVMGAATQKGANVVTMMPAPVGPRFAWVMPMMTMQPMQTDAIEASSSHAAPSSHVAAAASPVSAAQPDALQLPRRGRPGKPGATTAPVTTSSPSSVLAAPATDGQTTLMLRNLPNQYTRDMLVEMLNKEGFAGKYNLVYLPIDFKTHAGLGYAFVDVTTPSEADRMRQYFEGFSRWALRSEKICSVSWSHPEQQGLDAHIRRYRNSPVMHESVRDSWKPALYANGMRKPFPAPTRKLRNPRIHELGRPEAPH